MDLKLLRHFDDGECGRYPSPPLFTLMDHNNTLNIFFPKMNSSKSVPS